MKIEVSPGVYWDNEVNVQSEAAYEWLQSEIYPSLATRQTDTERVQPVYDQWGRPVEWVIETEMVTITVTRRYRDADRGTWAKERDLVNVLEKEVTNG